jgi:hypothetical protein
MKIKPNHMNDALSSSTVNDCRKYIGVEDKANKLGHDLSSKTNLSPEEIAMVIWKQWKTIRRLVDANSIPNEISPT